MSKGKNKHTNENLQEVEHALTATEQFFEKNQKIITYIFGAGVVVAILFLAFHRYYKIPREKKARSQMFVAEQYFQKDSFNLALNGDGNYPGFLDILDEYGSTSSGHLARYYTGISYLHLGKYEQAIEYLDDFSTDDPLIGPIARGATGDAYAELGNNEKAVSRYMDAANMNDNQFTSPVYLMKAGNLYETMGKYEDALKVYKTVKEKYPESNEARQIDKYIARASILAKK
jgi:tetratricopeptide (TPR) repeat protein